MQPRALTFTVMTPLLLLATTEFAARHLFDGRTRLAVAEQRTFAAYRNAPSAAQYFADVVSCASQSARAHEPRFARYVLQDINEDCTTPTVNYRNRLRQTWTPDRRTAVDDGYAVEIGMFGGSTMEGLGAIDDETIPSVFAQLANTSLPDGRTYHVVNYGVSSYTFTQSVFKFLTLLRDGHHFDNAIFDGGANDVEYAYDLGSVGALYGEDVVRTKVEGSFWDQAALITKEQINACVLCLGGLVLIRNAPLLKDHLPHTLVRMRDWLHFRKGQAGGDDVGPTAGAIADYYAQSHALLIAVARAYHVDILEFWQPTLMYDGYAPGEAILANSDPRLSDDKLRRLYARARDATVVKHLDRFWDLSHSLDERPGAVYLDAVHVSGEGNRRVARQIYDIWLRTQEPQASLGQ
jgi:lysophospholipase L1-like esterase